MPGLDIIAGGLLCCLFTKLIALKEFNGRWSDGGEKSNVVTTQQRIQPFLAQRACSLMLNSKLLTL